MSAQVTYSLKTAQPLEPSVGWATMEIRDGILFFLSFFFLKDSKALNSHSHLSLFLSTFLASNFLEGKDCF